MTTKLEAAPIDPDDQLAQLIVDAERTGEWLPVIGAAMKARTRAENGDFCRCETPIVHGLDLMCGRCLRQNKDQEIAKVAQMCGPHDFTLSDRPAGSTLRMCGICAGWEDDVRHHGGSIPRGRYTWE